MRYSLEMTCNDSNVCLLLYRAPPPRALMKRTLLQRRKRGRGKRKERGKRRRRKERERENKEEGEREGEEEERWM